MNNATLDSGCGGLGPIGDSQFTENIIDMTLDGGFADFQEGANFLVTLAGDDLLEYFEFSTGEF